MKKEEIINKFIKKYYYKKYLEIGVFTGFNFEQIECLYKDGVDPGAEGVMASCANYQCTSDEFFEQIKNKDIKYDFIFIDGLHHSEQVDKDIKNSLKHISNNGVIMLHDANPYNFEMQEVPRKTGLWTGDVWKSIIKIRYNNPQINYFTIDTDFGCTILKKGERIINHPVSIEKALEWEYFNNNKNILLNLISVDLFLETFNIL